jgi:hypothetical protein
LRSEILDQQCTASRCIASGTTASDQKSMPPMPPSGGMEGPPADFFGSSAIMASVVIRSGGEVGVLNRGARDL